MAEAIGPNGTPMSTQGVPVGPPYEEHFGHVYHEPPAAAPAAPAEVVPDGSNNLHADILAAAKAGSAAQVQASCDFKESLPNLGESTGATTVVDKGAAVKAVARIWDLIRQPVRLQKSLLDWMAEVGACVWEPLGLRARCRDMNPALGAVGVPVVDVAGISVGWLWGRL